MSYKFPENIQRGILNLAKSEQHFIVQTQNIIQSEYFESEIHQLIYETSLDYFRKFHKLPNDDVIVEQLTTKANAKNISLSEIRDELDEIAALDETYRDNPDYYLDITESFAKRESLKDAIRDSIELIEQERLEEVEDIVRKALLVSRHVDIGKEYFSTMVDRYKNRDDGNVIKYPTVLKSITANLEGGNSPKELCYVVAPPGVGKSLYLVNQAVTTMMQNKKALYISLEMSEEKVAARFDSVISRIPSVDLKGPTAAVGLKQTLGKFKKHFPESGLIIKEFPTGAANVQTIRTLLYNLKNMENFEPDVIFVDYLELLRPVRTIDSEYAAQQRIAEELRGLAVEHEVLVWTATQPNRDGKKVPIITDAQLGDSYGKIRVADFAISLNQTDAEYEEGKARVYVMKARDAKQRYIVMMDIDYSTLVMKQSAHAEVVTDMEDIKNKLEKMNASA